MSDEGFDVDDDNEPALENVPDSTNPGGVLLCAPGRTTKEQRYF
jgi:hypothetical protein